MSQPVAQPAAKKKSASYTIDCVVLGGPDGPIIAAGPAFGPDVSVNRARFILSAAASEDPWMGFGIRFPLGSGQERNEEAGFGARYKGKSSTLLLFFHFGFPLSL